MLAELKVSNFAIIDKVHVRFRSGFNVLSGETGSGKSVLLKSLALLMGEKSISDTIKTGCEQATVEGSFDLSARQDIKERLVESGIANSPQEVEDILIVKRVISHDGKNRVYINGALATLLQLKNIVSPLVELTGQQAPLIEMTGQHDNRHLQTKNFHLDSLDQYIGQQKLRQQVEQLYHQHAELKNQWNELLNSAREKSLRLDFLTYQRDEITALNLKPGDEERLSSQARLIKESAQLAAYAEEAEKSLYSYDESVLVLLHRVIQRGQDLKKISPELTPAVELLQQAKTLIEESVYLLRDYAQKITEHESQTENIESQMNALRKLQKLHGPTAQDILQSLSTIEAEITLLENSEARLTEIESELKTTHQQLLKKSMELHAARLGGAETLAKSVNAELADLNMKGVMLSVRVDKLAEVVLTGVSDVEFMIQVSKKDEPKSLAKFASGGELSRIMLALKRVVGLSPYPRTYLFDEVDTGVSGVTAEKVGRKLKSIAKGQQVICVTHLPQVAAFADAHFVINKKSDHQGVHMTVDFLDNKLQVEEIARMLSGEKITKTSLQHAKELIASAT
jgi:DNA repair protein RecN (Recombination protein N)